jgi:hypothetical protein
MSWALVRPPGKIENAALFQAVEIFVVNLWWLDTSPAALWSPEERRARMAIYGLAIPIFLAIFGIEILASTLTSITTLSR